jgi:uncharacterized protein (TIGR03083 family)
MEYPTFVQYVRGDGERLVSVAGPRLPDPVPSCPGWTVDDLVRHVAEVYEHKIACTLLGHAPEPWPPDWPTERDPVDWLVDAHGRLLEMFDRSEPTTPSATWWPPDQTVGFWARRMAHETAVHRVDAELAASAATPIDPELAADGVDEILRRMLAGDWSEDVDDAATGQRIVVSTGGHRWGVILTRDAVTIEDEPGDPDALLEGDPSDVDLWLWGRAPDDRLSRTGDLSVLRLFRSRLALATQ